MAGIIVGADPRIGPISINHARIVGADPRIGPKKIDNFRQGRIWESARTGILIILVFLIYRFVDKDSLMGVTREGLPPIEAGVLAGMVLGDKGGIGKDLYELMKNSGLVHMVVASGANVMLIFGGAVELGAMVWGRKKTIVAGLILMWWYAGMVGWEIPIIRAVVLVSIMYFAQLWGRKFSVWRGLGLTVVIMWLADLGMWTEVSFWMSLMAFGGVLTRKLLITNDQSLVGNRKVGSLLIILIDTVWVSVWVMPVMALVFGRISVVSWLTNTMVIGLVEVATVVGGVGMLSGLIWPGLGKVILWLVYPILRYFVWVVETTGNWQWSNVAVRFNAVMLVGWYLILGWWLVKKGGWR